MLLQALHKYAEQRKLLDRLPFQVRTVHLLIPLNADGSVRGNGFVPLTTLAPKKKGEKDNKVKPGRKFILPRFPGEKNNPCAQYLCDPIHVVLGLVKDKSDPLPDSSGKKIPDPVQQFRMFWEWIDEAVERLKVAKTPDSGLEAIQVFSRRHLETVRGWVQMRQEPMAKAAKLCAKLETGWYPLKEGNVVCFEVPGRIMAVSPGRRLLDYTSDHLSPIWNDWSGVFESEFRKETGDNHLGVDRPSICLVSGTQGQQIAAKHKPEVKVPGTPPKGAPFFSVGSPAYQSYGLGEGGTATVSIPAAAGYALALEDQLADPDAHFTVGNVTFCFWAEKNSEAGRRAGMAVRNASSVSKFLKSPFAGLEGYEPNTDVFRSLALGANAGRIVVCDWIQVPVANAVANFQNWFKQLEVAPLGKAEEGDGEKAGPYSLFRLAYAVLPKRKGENAKSARAQVRNRIILELYSKAIDGTPVSLALLPRLLEEYVTALITDNPKQKKPTYPLGRSRFALLKLLLIRNHTEGEFMPRVHLAADTPDQAYNLGRLLAILARVQKKAHEERKNGKVDKKLEGPGIVQRYYGGASTSPRTIFPVLFKLSMHHLRKLEQNGDGGARTAEGFRAKIGDVLKLIPKTLSGDPDFKAVLDLKDQARFALGYYQQYAYDRIASRVGHLLGEAKKAHKNKDAQLAKLCLDQAKQAVTLDDYPDLFQRVNNFKLEPNKE